MEEKIKIIYIAGFGRNGGTLLDRILGQTRNFFSLGEFKFVWQKGVLKNELCNCGRPFQECDFWKEVFQSAFDGFDIMKAQHVIDLSYMVDQTRYIPLLISPWKPQRYQNLLNEYTEMLKKLYLSVQRVSKSAVIVDSSKFAGYALVLSSIPEIELYIVHLVRDSRANAYSWLRKKKKPEILNQEAYLRRYSVFSSSLQWMYRNLTSEWLKFFAKEYMMIKYEDFTKSPKTVYEKIIGMLNNISPDDSVFESEFTTLLGNSHTQSGNPVRFQQGSVEIREDNAWESKMKVLDKLTVLMLTWPFLIRYGYLFKSDFPVEKRNKG